MVTGCAGIMLAFHTPWIIEAHQRYARGIRDMWEVLEHSDVALIS